MGMLRSVVLLVFFVVLAQSAPFEFVRAAGATFPVEVYAAWSYSYFAENPNVLVMYDPIGSTAGKERIVNGTDIVFAASDTPLSAEQYQQVPDLQMMPLIAGGIVAFTKTFERLQFTRELLVDVFLGKVDYWDDERIVAQNPFANLEHERIIIIYRTDSSGTTSVLTSAFSKFSSEWAERYGTVSTWPEDLVSDSRYMGVEGSEGVFTLSTLTRYSISYVSFSFIQNSLSNIFHIRLENKAGNIVACTANSVTAATEDAEFDETFATDITDSGDPNAWPISTFTYMIIRTQTTAPELCDELRRGLDLLAFGVTYYTPKFLIQANGFAPVSDTIIQRIANIFEGINCGGEGGFNLYNPLPQAPRPPTYYYDSFSDYEEITTASYSTFFDSIGSSISASEANEYEPSSISSLYESQIVTRNYYEGNDESSGSKISPISNVFMILMIGFTLLFSCKLNTRFVIFVVILFGLCLNVFGTELILGGFFPLTGDLANLGSSEEAAVRAGISILQEGYLQGMDLELEYYAFNTNSTPTQGIRSLSIARDEFNIFGILGCHDDLTSGSVALTSGLFLLPQISYASRANVLSDGFTYPYFARVIPPFASEGTALALLIQEYGWENIGVIFSSDDYGVLTAKAFRDTYEGINNVNIVETQFTPGSTNLHPQMSVLRNSLVRIIVMFPSTSLDAATIIHEASRYHLIGDDFIWFGGVFASSSNVFFDPRSELTDQVVKGLAKGMIGLKLKGGFGTKYEEFLDAWENLDYTQFSGSGRRYAPLHVAYAYDALELFVRTYVERDFINLSDFMFGTRQVNFTGLTGPIRLNQNEDRLAIFDVVNLRNTEEGDHGWVEIGTWFETHRDTKTKGFDFDYKVQFHSGSTEVPDVEVRPSVRYWSCKDRKFKVDESGKIELDAPGPDAENIADFYHCDTFIDCKNFSDETNECPDTNYLAAFVIIGVITGILIIFSCLLIPFIILFGYIHKLLRVRSASPPFLLIIVISIIFGFASVYAWFGQPNAVGCGFQPWLLGLGIISMVAALCAKNIRIILIFKNPLKRTTISDQMVLLLWLIMVIPAVFILFLWTLISTPTTILEKVDGQQHYVCDTGGFTGPPGGYIFFGIFVAYTLIILLIGAVIAFFTRKIPSLFNESKLITISIYNLVLLAVIIIPVYFVLLTFNPFVAWIIRSLAILYGFSATLFLMFIPKIIGVCKDGFKNTEATIAKSSTASVNSSGSH